MSQVKKLEGGGTTDVATATPVPTIPQYTFKINGTEYKKDEQSLRDQFTPIFNDLVQRGEASERDKDKWVSSYNSILDNVKNGTYNLQSSGNQIMQMGYDGKAAPSTLGLNADGTTARKTGIGNIISKASKNDAQRASMLDHYFGNSVLTLHGTDEQKNKADAEVAAKAKEELDAKNKTTALGAAFDKVNQMRRGYGEATYGSNFVSSPNLILDPYWGKDTTSAARYSKMRDYTLGQYKQLYDPSLDAYKDDLKSKGFDLDQVRNTASKYYDPATGKFKVKAATLNDFEELSNPFGTMNANHVFTNKAAYDTLHQPQQGAPGQPGGPAKELQADGDYFSDGKHLFTDKTGTTPFVGFNKNGKLYDKDGSLYNYDYVHNGDYHSPFTGNYHNGEKVDAAKSASTLEALAKNPANAQGLAIATERRSQMQQAYDAVYNNKEQPWATDFSGKTQTNVIGGENLTNGTLLPAGKADAAVNTTDAYNGLKNAHTFSYRSKATDSYGNPQVFDGVLLKSGKKFYGKIKTDFSGNVVGMNDVDGHPINDAELKATLTGTRFNKDADVSKSIHDFSWASKDPYSATNATHDGASFEWDKRGLLNSVGNYLYQSANENKPGGQKYLKEHPYPVSSWQAGGQLTGKWGNDAPVATKDQPTASAGAVTIGDVKHSLNDPNFKLSGTDKAELVGLALNLGGVAASFTGAGSVVGAGLGAAGSLTQYGADIAKHGFQWGDLGSTALNLGLDAASAIPGLGILGEGSKAVRTISKLSRILIPALTVAGMAKSAGVVSDLASGKKGFSDLSVDDIQALVGGIHGIIGGARNITQRMGTTSEMVTKLKLDDGSINIKPEDAALISAAPDKVVAAKEVASRITGRPVDQIKLDEKTLPNFTLNPFKNGLTKTVEQVKMPTEKATVLKNVDDYQGWNPKDFLMRRAINLTAIRNPQLVPGEVNQKWSALGDYGKERVANPAQPEPHVPGTGAFSVVPNGPLRLPQVGGDSQGFGGKVNTEATVGDIPDTRRIYGSMFGMRNLDSERKISYEQLRNRISGLAGTKSSNTQLNKFMSQTFDEGTFAKTLQDQISQAASNPDLKGWLKFKDGGILKAQNGNRMPFLSDDQFSGGGLNSQIPSFAARRKVIPQRVAQTRQPLMQQQAMPALKVGNVNQPLSALPSSAPVGVLAPKPQAQPNAPIGTNWGSNPWFNNTPAAAPTTNPPATLPGKAGLVAPNTASSAGNKFHIDPTTVSEFARAMATSKLNEHFDTRVERPLADAPNEVPISVHGDIAAEAAANKGANDLIAGSQQFRTSDGSLQMLGNLQAQQNAAGLRMQGTAQSNAMLEQTRGQAQQSAVQNAQARTAVANQNTDTLARAKQAERAGENQKFQQVNQPMMDFWKDTNYKNYVQSREDRAIDTQIGGLSEEAKIRQPMNNIQNEIYKVSQDQTLTPQQQNAKILDLQNQGNLIQDRFTRKSLEIRKNPYSFTPGNAQYYNPAVPLNKEGGAVKLQIQENKSATSTSNEIAKQSAQSIKEASENETKKSLQAMKDINDLIRMALK